MELVVGLGLSSWRISCSWSCRRRRSAMSEFILVLDTVLVGEVMMAVELGLWC